MIPFLKFRLSVLQFLQFFIWGSWFVTAGTYFQQTLGFSGLEVGMIYGTTAIAATISPFLLGILADRFFSVEKLLGILHLAGSVLLYTLAQIQTFEWFYPLMLIYVLCYLPTFSLSNALCFHHIEDTKRDFPQIRVWGTISWIIVGLIIGWLKVEDQATPFYIAAACSVVQGLYSFTLPETPPQERQENLWQSLRGPEMQALFRDRSLIVMIIAIALICLPLSYYYSFVNSFLNEQGVVNAAGKMSLGQVTEILFMLTLPWFFKIWRLRTIIFIGLLSWGVRYGCFIAGIHYNSEAWYILGLLFHGLAYIFSMLSAQIYLDTRVPSHLRSTGQGFYSLLTLGVGVFVGSYIAGQSVTRHTIAPNVHDWTQIWWFPFWFGIVVAFGFLILFKGRQKA
ncbi:MAG: MFS transporter [Bacteroidota bacterium]